MKLTSLRISVTFLVVLIGGFAWAGDSVTDLRITSLGNEGFLIEAEGRVVMIDALYVGLPGYVAPTEEIGSIDLRDRNIDVAFVPFWLLEERQNARSYLEPIGAAAVVAMHIPASDAPPSYLAPGKDLEDLIRLLEDITPGVVILPEVMDTRVFTSGTSKEASIVYRGCSQVGSNE